MQTLWTPIQHERQVALHKILLLANSLLIMSNPTRIFSRFRVYTLLKIRIVRLRSELSLAQYCSQKSKECHCNVWWSPRHTCTVLCSWSFRLSRVLSKQFFWRIKREYLMGGIWSGTSWDICPGFVRKVSREK